MEDTKQDEHKTREKSSEPDGGRLSEPEDTFGSTQPLVKSEDMESKPADDQVDNTVEVSAPVKPQSEGGDGDGDQSVDRSGSGTPNPLVIRVDDDGQHRSKRHRKQCCTGPTMAP